MAESVQLGASDISLLVNCDEGSIAQNLLTRLKNDVAYTSLGPSVLLSVNPCRPLNTYTEVYSNLYCQALEKNYSKPPHIFSVASGSFYDLILNKRDQSIVLLGECGSGKSEGAKHLVRHFMNIGSSEVTKKEARLRQRILKAPIILETFGNARTVFNPNSSRFGLHYEIQYAASGKLVGSQIYDYLLEKTRLTNCPKGERNFHIFYSMLAGLSSEEKSALRLVSEQKYQYLQNTTHDWEDLDNHKELITAMKVLGIGKRLRGSINQVLAAILHIGNIEFVNDEKAQASARIRNRDLVEFVSSLLEVDLEGLEAVLTTKSNFIKKELCTVFLDSEQASVAAATLCKNLYSLLFTWIVEYINTKICNEKASNYISITDFPGFENCPVNRFEQFCVNYADEKFHSFFNKIAFESELNNYATEGITLTQLTFLDNSACLELYERRERGLFSLLDEESAKAKKGKDAALLESFNSGLTDSKYFVPVAATKKNFAIRHFSGQVNYDIKHFVEKNKDLVNPDVVALFRNSVNPNSFSKDLFVESAISTELHPRDKSTIVVAQQPKKPTRNPSIRINPTTEPERKKISTLVSQFPQALNELLESIERNKIYFVLCLKPNISLDPDSADQNYLMKQIVNLGIVDAAKLQKIGYPYSMKHEEFVTDFNVVFKSVNVPIQTSNIKEMMAKLNIKSSSYAITKSFVFLRKDAWESLMTVYHSEKEASEFQFQGAMNFENDKFSVAGSDHSAETDFTNINNALRVAKIDIEAPLSPTAKTEDKKEIPPPKEMTTIRYRWLGFTKFCTWWIPDSYLRCMGMKRPDIMLAWREKVALCCIVFFLSAFLFFYIIAVPLIICPPQNVLTKQEMLNLADPAIRGASNLIYYASVRGQLFDLTKFASSHANPTYYVGLAGLDMTPLFPKVPCAGFGDTPSTSSCVVGSVSHCHTASDTSALNGGIVQGFSLAYSLSDVIAASVSPNNFIVVNGNVYNITAVLNKTPGKIPSGALASRSPNDYDRSGYFGYSGAASDLACLSQYRVGVIDNRDSIQCKAAEILLIGSTAIIAAIMVFKFLAALQFSSKSVPEDLDKFVILQVPCYTEGEESLRKTLDSLSVLKYDDKRKLLFIVCDGMIIGSGNDRPTPRIVLDILGVDPSIDPEPLSFISLGEGSKQHNMGKVYSGLYECTCHRVPYIVVVKVGKPSERSRPGNRGKRDSQLILMKFLNRVHYKTPMVPLELEMYHQIKNVIGVDPAYYEYVLMVDADTEVVPDSLNLMICRMLNDKTIMGLCGETEIANEKDTWITMIQVYEYYISHHVAKAFESLFGSVTCLPGCFCMYRIKTPVKQQALIISNQIIEDYSENNVDTLHKKNLLSLGEDRYLTTLMLRTFPEMKTKFTPDALCRTVAPDRWSVLLSQRRRWINSTVHNLFELLMLPQMCGCCLFSMRFVIMIDLFATLVMPATFLYLIYMIYDSVTTKTIPIESLYLVAGIYGMQMIIFLLKLQWQHFGWMIINIIAMPAFSFFIPLYAFWHFDDFSWGNTRMVLGERGQVVHMGDSEVFDPSTIPTRKWNEYENEMPERQYTGYQQSEAPRESAYQAFSINQDYSSSSNNLVHRADPMPSDEEIVMEVRNILSTANLMNITKKQVRDQLGLFFNVDMNSRKDFINQIIELILQGQL